MNKMDEIIIVAPRSKTFENEYFAFQGIQKEEVFVNRIVENINESFTLMRRGDAEENLLYKQPIPYAIIQRGDQIFVYSRLQGAGESRLHGKLSLGVEGHMNFIEGLDSFQEQLSENLLRELQEELYVEDQNFEVKTIGLINDDTDEVGRVHIGVLCVIKVAPGSDVEVREVDQLSGMWLKIEDLKKKEVYDRLENWSKIAVDIL